MSAIYHAHLSEVEKIQEQITQLEAERKAISARIRRLKVQKKEWQDRSTQMDHDVQMQEKIIRVRSTLPKVPMDLPTYRRTADTQQRRCKILWQVMIDEGLLSVDDTPCDVCILAGPKFAKACTSYSYESCPRCLETDDICFYNGVLPSEERVEALKELSEELDRLTSAFEAMAGDCQ